jgi:hypothetical protein
MFWYSRHCVATSGSRIRKASKGPQRLKNQFDAHPARGATSVLFVIRSGDGERAISGT